MIQSVGLLTFVRVLNYGTALQAFALQRTIRGLVSSCTIIDYLRRERNDPYFLFWPTLSREALSHNVRSLLKLGAHLRLRRRFQEFRDRHLTMTPDSYRTWDDMDARGPHFEAYVVGSDQVWQPRWLGQEHGRVFYLEFVRAGCRRVAYAPSFGLPAMPPEHRERAAALLRHFDFLSAREDSGVRIIRELTGQEVEQVMDPALLLGASDYDPLAIAPPQARPYILLYPIQLTAELHELARKLKKCLNLPLVALVPVYHVGRAGSEFGYADRVIGDAGPAEFLGWIKNAAFVCTNAFHGAVLSIVYRKDFLTVPHRTTNTRNQSMLSRLGLLQREVAVVADLQPGDSRLGPIDYAPVAARIAENREQSLGFLRRALA